jgi:ribonuclease P protein component
VSVGSWTAYVAPSPNAEGRLIVALGRSAGGSVTRSLARRLARDVFKSLRNEKTGLDLLLLARDDIRKQTRRDIRNILLRLMMRGADAVSQRRSAQGDAGG